MSTQRNNNIEKRESFFSDNSWLIIGILLFDAACMYWLWAISGAGYESGAPLAWPIPIQTLALLGDSMGAINAIFSGFALFFMVVALRMQSKELALQREELANTRAELKRSADTHENNLKEQAGQNNFIKYFQHQDIFIARFEKQVGHFGDIYLNEENSILLHKHLYKICFPDNSPEKYRPIFSGKDIYFIDDKLVELCFYLDAIINTYYKSSGMLCLVAFTLFDRERSLRDCLLAPKIPHSPGSADMYVIDFYSEAFCSPYDFKRQEFCWSDACINKLYARVCRYAQFINEIKLICDNTDGLATYFPSCMLGEIYRLGGNPERSVVSEMMSCNEIKLEKPNRLLIEVADKDYDDFQALQRSAPKKIEEKSNTRKFNKPNCY